MAEATPKTSAPKKSTAKPAKANATAKKTATQKTDPAAAVKKTPAPRKSAEKKAISKTPVSGEQRYRMIAEAAYFRAESRNFESDPVRDWIEAERDIVILLGEE